MKVVQSIEALYVPQKEMADLLKVVVDKIFERVKENNWHYISRVKQLESFALKLETGRFTNPSNLEDFFACTLVVENIDQINKAISLIRQELDVKSQRPKNPRFTHKESWSFQFDDLRLYATIKKVPFLPDDPLTEIVFEIQIKTFLQHAWGLATHDLIYKTDEINWSKERIAYQIKAMLEQAELTISGVSNLVNFQEVSKDNWESRSLKKILRFYKDFFSNEDLPKDLVRLCQNTWELAKALELEISDLRAMMTRETEAGRGSNLKNLSPFLLVIQSIINQQSVLIQDFVNGSHETKFKILIPKELQLDGVALPQETKRHLPI